MRSRSTSSSVLKAFSLPERWAVPVCTRLSAHNAPCCQRARAWLRAANRAFDPGGRTATSGPPTWLTDRYTWGPCNWPLHWCDVIRLETLDCGGFAALARICFDTGSSTVYPAHVVQRFTIDQTTHWKRRWENAGASTDWIEGPHVLHEACAVPDRSSPDGASPNVRLWDSTTGTWISSSSAQTLALRIGGGNRVPASVQWADRSIPTNTWQAIET